MTYRISFQHLCPMLLASLILTGCGGDNKKAGGGPAGMGPGGPGGPQKPQTYSVASLSPQTVTTYIDYPTTIEGQQNVEIRPKVDGYLEAIYIDEGATVKKGQRLFRINAPQYAEDIRTAEAQIKTAEADVNAAQMAVNKVKPLVEKDIISAFELESAEYTLQSKKAALAQARSSLANARIDQGYTLLASPVSGVAGSIPYKIGSLVSSTTTEPLTTISNINSVYAYFSLNEKQLLSFTGNAGGKTIQEKLAKMQEVSLILPDGSEYSRKGRITTGIGQIDSETGSMRLRATFPNPESLLRSGNSGTVRVPRTIDSALIVPQSATYELQGKRFVYTVGADSVAKSTEVTTTPTSDGQYFIIEKGLDAQSRVVLDGVSSLKDGAKIIPKPVSAPVRQSAP